MADLEPGRWYWWTIPTYGASPEPLSGMFSPGVDAFETLLETNHREQQRVALVCEIERRCAGMIRRQQRGRK